MKKTEISLFICAFLSVLMLFGCKWEVKDNKYLDRPDVVVDTDLDVFEIRGKYINSNTASITILRQNVDSSEQEIERVAVIFPKNIEDTNDQTFSYKDEKVLTNKYYRYYLIFTNDDGTRNRTEWSDKKKLTSGGADSADKLKYDTSSSHYVFDNFTLTAASAFDAPDNSVITDINDYNPALVFAAGDRIQVFEITNITVVDLKSLLPEYYFGKQVQLLGIVGQRAIENSSSAEIKEIRWTNIAPVTVKNSSGDTLEYLDLKQKFGTTDGYDYSLTSNNEN
ncbi:MAG: hypothetical protein J6T20_08995 [Treponema sp.]|nr:hypothetical protein [Treponema sp.]